MRYNFSLGLAYNPQSKLTAAFVLAGMLTVAGASIKLLQFLLRRYIRWESGPNALRRLLTGSSSAIIVGSERVFSSAIAAHFASQRLDTRLVWLIKAPQEEPVDGASPNPTTTPRQVVIDVDELDHFMDRHKALAPLAPKEDSEALIFSGIASEEVSFLQLDPASLRRRLSAALTVPLCLISLAADNPASLPSILYFMAREAEEGAQIVSIERVCSLLMCRIIWIVALTLSRDNKSLQIDVVWARRLPQASRQGGPLAEGWGFHPLSRKKAEQFVAKGLAFHS